MVTGLSVVMIALPLYSTNGLSERFLSSATKLRRPLYVLLAFEERHHRRPLLTTPMDLMDLESEL